MKTLDKIFQIVFGRYRRKMGDSNLESAWLRAANRVTGYLVFPISAASLMLIVVVHAFTGTGTLIEHKRTGQIIAVVAGLVIFYLLNRRFRKYLSVPPALPPLEAGTDTQLVFWFRAISIGIFALTCLAGLFSSPG